MAFALSQGPPRFVKRDTDRSSLARRVVSSRESCRQVGQVAAGSCEDIGKVSFVSLGCPKNTVDGKVDKDRKKGVLWVWVL